MTDNNWSAADNQDRLDAIVPWHSASDTKVGELLNSGNNDQSTHMSENQKMIDDYYQFQELSLENHDIPAYISLPDETANIGASTKPIINHIKDDIKWSIKIGENFELLIEDYGYIDDLVEVKKKELSEQTFFQVNYLIDEPNLILYERTLLVKGIDKASPNVGVEHKSFHIYASKVINEITYEFKSREDGNEKIIVELIAKAVKSINSI